MSEITGVTLFVPKDYTRFFETFDSAAFFTKRRSLPTPIPGSKVEVWSGRGK